MFSSLCPPVVSHLQGLFFFSNSTVKIQDSQAYRNVEMTRERISFTFEPRERFITLQMGFSFVRAVAACAILERISCLEPSSETTASKYLKLVTVPSLAASALLPLPSCLSSVWSSRQGSPSYTLCRFCRDFLLGLLAPALPQLEHLLPGW